MTRDPRPDRLSRSPAAGRRALDAPVAALAARQHGVITRRQLLDAGLTSRQVDVRVRRRRLRPVHRGVYLLGDLTGTLVPPRAREMAAVLACGPGAVLSHASAAALWGLLPPEAPGAPVHVTVCGCDRGRRPGIRPHRIRRRRRSGEVTAVEGVPVTTPAVTVVDLAGAVEDRELEQAFGEAERRDLLDPARFAALLQGRARIPGAPALRSLLESSRPVAWTRSAAEERFLALVRSGGLPAPRTNARVAGYEVDFLWRQEGIAVEVDGFAHHRSRASFERDRRRDADLAGRGIRVVRVTWRQLSDEPNAVLVRLARAMAHPNPHGTGRG